MDANFLNRFLETGTPISLKNDRDANPVPLKRCKNQCDCDCACSIFDSSSIYHVPNPIAYSLELTPDCLNRCPGCGNVFIDRGLANHVQRPMELAKWGQILDKVASTATLVKLTGGEPTLYPDFFPLLSMIRSKNINFGLLTTGRWPSTRQLLDELQKQPSFEGFLISLHGSQSGIHQAFTNTVGSFERATQSIKIASQAGFDVSVNCVLVKPNLHDLLMTTELAVSLGANQVIFGRFIGFDFPGLTLSDAELHQAIDAVLFMQKKGYPVKFGNCIPQCFAPSTSSGCSAGETFCTVDPWGNVRPCNHAPLITGNLLVQSIEDIWNSQLMHKWRQIISTECTSCEAFERCRGGCKAMACLNKGMDPLYKGRLSEYKDSNPANIIPLEIHAWAIPKMVYKAYRFPSETLLTAQGKAIIVTPEELEFLEQTIQKHTMEEIQNIFGVAATNYLGNLYLQGMVDLIT